MTLTNQKQTQQRIVTGTELNGQSLEVMRNHCYVGDTAGVKMGV